MFYRISLSRLIAQLLEDYSPLTAIDDAQVDKCEFLRHDDDQELNKIKTTCARHADLCRQYADCSLALQMNDAQLDILSETAETLRQRHARIRRIIDEKPCSPKELEALEAEIASVIRQVAVWTKELEEVNANRLDIEIRFLQLDSELKKSVTCMQLASIDFELIQLRHNERWRRFLADHVPSDKLFTLVQVLYQIFK
uniref:Uncharacterized protein n=1 Tax=Angiostrongylus cantonensis TaxID=6313 RepID=A0A0K0DE94_ANGCA